MKFVALIIFMMTFFANATVSQKASISQLWKTYETWLVDNYSTGFKSLNSGATENQLSQLEIKIGHKLPPKYREWLKIHNGQNHSGASLLPSGSFNSTSDILAEWKIMKNLLDEGKFIHPSESNPSRAIKPVWWSSSWIPISGDGSGNLLCIDMSPDKKGKVGQVIDFDHETSERVVLAENFEQYIYEYIQDLDAGKYKYSPNFGQILTLEDYQIYEN